VKRIIGVIGTAAVAVTLAAAPAAALPDKTPPAKKACQLVDKIDNRKSPTTKKDIQRVVKALGRSGIPSLLRETARFARQSKFSEPNTLLGELLVNCQALGYLPR
jgi:hypothetical protein